MEKTSFNILEEPPLAILVHLVYAFAKPAFSFSHMNKLVVSGNLWFKSFPFEAATSSSFVYIR